MRNWQAKIRPHWTHWIEIVLAAAVVVVAVAVGTVQISIYNQQAKIMATQAEIAQKQADIMNTQADIAQRQLAEIQSEGRAWVSIEPFVGGATWDADGLHIEFKFVVKNTGKLPALYVMVNAKIETYFAHEKTLYRYSRTCVPKENVLHLAWATLFSQMKQKIGRRP
jgi:hypothetical protein